MTTQKKLILIFFVSSCALFGAILDEQKPQRKEVAPKALCVSEEKAREIAANNPKAAHIITGPGKGYVVFEGTTYCYQ